MFDKATAYARRGLVTMKHHAKEAYRHGTNLFNKLDYGYQVFKKLHQVAAPMLKDAGVHGKTSKAISQFHSLRDKVMEAHGSAVRAVGTIRTGVPELGL